MTQGAAARLYTPELLGLAVELADYPLDAGFPWQGEAVSRTCGSTLAIGFDRAADGTVARLGIRVSACAVGQAPASIVAREGVGSDETAIIEAGRAVEAWRAGGAPPAWSGIELLGPARAHAARHGAILLPWRAAANALSKPARRD